MLRRLRSIVLVIIAAAVGAALGKIALQARHRMDANEPLMSVEFRELNLRAQDFIPGLVAAFRVKDAPWSWFHIPGWMAAFAVNFGIGAAGGDITALKARVERMAFDAVGLDAREFGMGGDPDGEEYADGGSSATAGRAAWGSPPPAAPPAE